MIEKPYYMLEFTAISCMFEIRINDTPVMTLNLKGQASTRIPVNHAIQSSGEQQVSIKVLPVLGQMALHQNTVFNYKIYLYDVTNGFEKKKMVLEYDSPRVSPSSPMPLLVSHNIFPATIPYTMKSYWEEGKELEDVDELHEKLRAKYKEIINAIQSRNYKQYQQKIANREHNIAVSMYLNTQESEARFKRLVRDFENGYDKVDFPEETIIIYGAYGKKASLKRKNGDPALSFVNEKEQEQQMLDIEFYFDTKTNGLEII